jgi:hypothetical protein
MKPLMNQRGISLIFVLAFMLLLMALGISAFTAAGMSHRAVLAQRERNRFTLYADSVERVVQGAVQTHEFTDLKVQAFYTFAHNFFNTFDFSDPGFNFNEEFATAREGFAWVMELTPAFPAGVALLPAGMAPEIEITVIVDSFDVDIHGGEWVQEFNTETGALLPLLTRVPTVAFITATVRVVQEVRLPCPVVAGDVSRRVTATVFENVDIRLEETNPTPQFEGRSIAPWADMDYLVPAADRGEWRVVSRETE